MTELTYGNLFAGYGGLEMGVQSVLGGESRWFAEFDAAPSKILAHHYPDVPNLGDVTKVKWAPDCPDCGHRCGVYRPHGAETGPGVFYWCGRCERQWDVSIRFADPEAHLIPEPVDVITGGSPCQDLSHAGKRKGMTNGTRSNLWAEMREAIAVIRPRLVVWENVRGALSAPADSDMEPCPGCVGGDGGDGQPVLRALGRVVGDLAELGYVGRYYGLSASDVGAAHGRFRIFLFATPADADGRRGYEALQHDGSGAPEGYGRGLPDQRHRDALRDGPDGSLTLLPTPSCNNAKESGHCRDFGGDLTHALLCGCDGRGSVQVEEGDALPDRVGDRVDVGRPGAVDELDADCGEGGPHRLLDVREFGGGGSGGYEREGCHGLTISAGPRDVNRPAQLSSWREYGPAIARAERALGRPAPAPTEPGAKGQPRLSPKFVEFLMMLPEGWVTGVPGIRRNDMLKALGNGVVIPQAAAATRAFVEDTAREHVAS